ncbi:MAG TPA: SDR family NAD(P)-dependent oxidoreductase [Anaerolineaceae bacterium]|nr:SDR family NAD(P)-dependent oxidoreductase [Anaerolineaceae bacterium]
MTQFADRSAHRSYVAITGAGGGLGKAFAVECASRGWDLFLTDLSPAPLEQLAVSLYNAYSIDVVVYPCDLTDAVARTNLFETIRSTGLRFWALINVAGLDYEGLFYQQTSQQIRTIIRLNIEGTLDMIHSLLEYRDPLQVFRIINVASLAAFYPMPVKATYAASKRFLLDFSRALRQEVRGLGATVTVLCPAGMPTTSACIQAIRAQGWMGQITTCDVGQVANQTLNAALAGRGLVIPGLINRMLQTLGALVPAPLVPALIGSRWKSAHQKRALDQRLAES